MIVFSIQTVFFSIWSIRLYHFTAVLFNIYKHQELAMEPILEISNEEEYQNMNNARSRIVILEKSMKKRYFEEFTESWSGKFDTDLTKFWPEKARKSIKTPVWIRATTKIHSKTPWITIGWNCDKLRKLAVWTRFNFFKPRIATDFHQFSLRLKCGKIVGLTLQKTMQHLIVLTGMGLVCSGTSDWKHRCFPRFEISLR